MKNFIKFIVSIGSIILIFYGGVIWADFSFEKKVKSYKKVYWKCGSSVNSCVAWSYSYRKAPYYGSSYTTYYWKCEGKNGWSTAYCNKTVYKIGMGWWEKRNVFKNSVIKKKKEKIKEEIKEKFEKDAYKINTVENVVTKWVISNNVVQNIEMQKTQSFDIQKVVPDYIKEKIWDANLSEINFDVDYSPNKVITFGDIRLLFEGLLKNYRLIFKCGTNLADEEVCWKIDNLLNSLKDYDEWKREFTINNLYKALLILTVLQKYQTYYLLYNILKGWTVLFTVDKTTNIISEIDFVRLYSTPDSNTNDFITFSNNKTLIGLSSTPPSCNSDEVCFVLWLSWYNIKWFKIYPFDIWLTIPGAKKYKFMKVEWMKKDNSCNFTDSVWIKYKDWKKQEIKEIGMWHNWKDLMPPGAEWIMFDIEKGCYQIIKYK